MSSKTALVLNYFGIAGRSTSIRAAAELAGEQFKSKYSFEVKPVAFEDWGNPQSSVRQDKVTFPTGDLPTLTINDGSKTTVMAESIAIITYIGQITGFWPTDAFEQARAIEVLVTAEQFINGAPEGPNDCALVPSFSIEDEEKKMAIRRGPVTDRLRIYFGRINQIVGTEGFSIGSKTTIIDFFLTALYLEITGGQFDGVDGKILESFTNIGKISGRVMADESMKPVLGKIMS